MMLHPVGYLMSGLLGALQVWALTGHLTWSNLVCFQTLERTVDQRLRNMIQYAPYSKALAQAVPLA